MVNKTSVKKSSSVKASSTKKRIKKTPKKTEMTESSSQEVTESAVSVQQPEQPAPSKGFWEWYMTSWKKTFSYAGRASRTEFFTFYLVNFFISFVLGFLSASLFPPELPSYIIKTPFYVFAIAVFLPSLAVYVRRFHDMGKSAWYAFTPYWLFAGLTVLVTIGAAVYSYLTTPSAVATLLVSGLFTLVTVIFLLSFLTWFVFLFLKGDPIPNQYGDVPEAPTKGVKIILFVLGVIWITLYAALIALTLLAWKDIMNSPNLLNSASMAQSSSVVIPYRGPLNKQIEEAVSRIAAVSLQNPALNSTGFNIPLPDGMRFIAAENGMVLFEVPTAEIAQQIQTNGLVCEENKCVFDARVYIPKSAY